MKMKYKVIGGLFALGLVCSAFGLGKPEQKPAPQPAPAAAEQKEEQSAGIPRHLVEQTLQEWYKKLYTGQGAPTVDVSFADYATWESPKGIIITKGTYTLSNEKGLTHEFSIRWAKDTGEMLYCHIDNERIYWNEDLETKIMDENREKK